MPIQPSDEVVNISYGFANRIDQVEFDVTETIPITFDTPYNVRSVSTLAEPLLHTCITLLTSPAACMDSILCLELENSLGVCFQTGQGGLASGLFL